MKTHITNKILITLIIFLLIIFLYQVTFAEKFSFSNPNIDNFFYFTKWTILLSIIFSFILFVFINVKRLGQKIAIGIVSFPIIIIFFVAVYFSIRIVLFGSSVNIRYGFLEKNNYTYYVISERFFAFEGSPNLKYYKEKTIFWFIKNRQAINENELNNLEVNLDKVNKNFYKIYFSKK